MERPNLPKGLPHDIEEKMQAARDWFGTLRDQICLAFEALEDESAVIESEFVDLGVRLFPEALFKCDHLARVWPKQT